MMTAQLLSNHVLFDRRTTLAAAKYGGFVLGCFSYLGFGICFGCVFVRLDAVREGLDRRIVLVAAEK
jgi:hypothetical protein